MSTENAVLALRLQGPMQAWGFNSQFNRRDTALFPSKSALAGLCCAAMGISRGSEEEMIFLNKFSLLKLCCISIPRKKKQHEIEVKRIQDYHTVQNTRDAKGNIKRDAILTYRQYLNDAFFIALLEGDKTFLGEVAEGTPSKIWCLQNPRWGIWLGRKACIPTSPVFAGIFTTELEAVQKLLEFEGKPIECFTVLREASSFGDGIDSYMDQPVSFDTHKRIFAPRRVVLYEAKCNI
jgi:CRISPR system Cascade subunit CasD